MQDDKECELVAVQLIRHRLTLFVSLSVVSVDNVWAILTDYDDLSKHVPNLVASRQISNKGGDPGDGSHRCRLYQRGLVRMLPWTCRIVVAGGGKKKIMMDGIEKEEDRRTSDRY